MRLGGPSGRLLVRYQESPEASFGSPSTLALRGCMRKSFLMACSLKTIVTPIFLIAVCLCLAHRLHLTATARPPLGTPGSGVSPRAHIRRTMPLSPYLSSRPPSTAVSTGSNTAFQALLSGSTLAGQTGYILPMLGRCLSEDNPDYKNGPYHYGCWSKTVRRVGVVWNYLHCADG